jgi:hypothetical protein
MPTLLTNPIYKPYGKSLYSRIDGSGILLLVSLGANMIQVVKWLDEA